MEELMSSNDKNVIVYEHLVIKKDIYDKINACLANPFDITAEKEMDNGLKALWNKLIKNDNKEYSDKKEDDNKPGKYENAELQKHIKLIYLFIAEGMKGAVAGRLLEPAQEQKVKEAFEKYKKYLPSGFPLIKVIGIEELNPILLRVEAANPGLQLKQFLLGADGKGGYDTPKIAAALIQLARRDFEHQEMFIRIDNDVDPDAKGIEELKKVYFDLINSPDNKQFCFSWNYFFKPLEDDCLVKSPDGPNYDDLFDHYVNSYSIRTTFLGDPGCLCQFDPETLSVSLNENEKNKPCKLNIIHAKVFVDLFKKGTWGSDLNHPISGAGMCFSADSLEKLPPWCNADELISWIDDAVKYETMRIYYGSDFDHSKKMLCVPGIPGFKQERNKAEEFKLKDVTGDYLDRLLMGCILMFAIEPTKYGPNLQGYGQVLKEGAYPAALKKWEYDIKSPLKKEAENHVRKVLEEWYASFCAKSDSNPLKEPAGFMPVTGNHFFNAYTIRQLIRLKQGSFDLVGKVFTVLDKYLKFRYIFWKHVVVSINTDRTAFFKKNLIKGPSGWLFEGLENMMPDEKKYARESVASFALISRTEGNETLWLLQWNSNWEVMNLISGHKEKTDANDLTCIIREIHEELFQNLSPERLEELQKTLGSDNAVYERYTSPWKDDCIRSVKMKGDKPLDYIDFSDSKKLWTKYVLHVYEVTLRTDVAIPVFAPDPFYSPDPKSCPSPKNPNEWVSLEDVRKGWTKMGRPISRTVKKIFGLLGLIK